MPNINELTLAKELIKFPSVTPKDAGAIGYLSKQLKKIGFDCKILEFRIKKVNQLKICTLDLEKKVQIYVMRVILM